MKRQKKFPEGHFIGLYMAIFMPLGIIYGMLLGPAFIGVGIGMGAAIGVAVGVGVEAKKKKEGLIRPLTKKEKANKKKWTIIGIITALVGAAALVAIIMISS